MSYESSIGSQTQYGMYVDDLVILENDFILKLCI